ncbi:MAG: FAD/NAD(P)-binding protein [Cyanobacteria bacterium J06629_19]
MVCHIKIAIAGAGISGFAALGYLVEAFRTMPSVKITLYLLQPPREIQTENLTAPQRERLAYLKSIGIDPSQLFGGGQVYHPAAPSLFTFNGNSTARGFNFASQRYDNTDYFEWIQENRGLLAQLYPDFAPENNQQRHPDHTLDDIQGTTPRGAYGLYLHDRFLALKAHLPKHIALQIIPEALQAFSQQEQTVTLTTTARKLTADYFVQATGHRFAELRSEWTGRVFKAYPCDRYGQPLPKQITVVGAGPAGIETALHALHNLNVEQVTLISRHAQSRLPQVEPTESYVCQWFTREKMQFQPTAANAKVLLQKELKACYQACNLPYPGWDSLLQIEDYSIFLEKYLETTNQSPNHPFAHLVRPVMSFYGQVKDLLSVVEQIGVLQLINQVKPLFATQSRPCAELMLAALKTKRLRLIAGEFLPDQATPTVLLAEGTQIHPDCIILATGFVSPILSFCPQPSGTRCYSVTGTSLSSVHRKAASVSSIITQAVKARALSPQLSRTSAVNLPD